MSVLAADRGQAWSHERPAALPQAAKATTGAHDLEKRLKLHNVIGKVSTNEQCDAVCDDAR